MTNQLAIWPTMVNWSDFWTSQLCVWLTMVGWSDQPQTNSNLFGEKPRNWFLLFSRPKRQMNSSYTLLRNCHRFFLEISPFRGMAAPCRGIGAKFRQGTKPPTTHRRSPTPNQSFVRLLLTRKMACAKWHTVLSVSCTGPQKCSRWGCEFLDGGALTSLASTTLTSQAHFRGFWGR